MLHRGRAACPRQEEDSAFQTLLESPAGLDFTDLFQYPSGTQPLCEEEERGCGARWLLRGRGKSSAQSDGHPAPPAGGAGETQLAMNEGCDDACVVKR